MTDEIDEFTQYSDGENDEKINEGGPGKLITAMISGIYRKDRIVMMDTGISLQTVQYLRRIHCYDPKGNKMVKQHGAIRSVEQFDLINIRPDVNSLSIEDFVQRGKRIREKHKMRLRSNLKKDNLPSDLIK